MQEHHALQMQPIQLNDNRTLSQKKKEAFPVLWGDYFTVDYPINAVEQKVVTPVFIVTDPNINRITVVCPHSTVCPRVREDD